MLLLTLSVTLAFAGSSTATATVTATVPSLTLVSLSRDTNSVTRGSATQIVFDKLDSVDMPGGDPGYMYAPYRNPTEKDKNWHIAQVIANGSTMVLGMSATGSIGATPLANILKVWCGGFYAPGATNPLTGTRSEAWEFANGWQRSLSQPFTGTVPFNYQLNVSSVGSGTYSGSITITLTTT